MHDRPFSDTTRYAVALARPIEPYRHDIVERAWQPDHVAVSRRRHDERAAARAPAARRVARSALRSDAVVPRLRLIRSAPQPTASSMAATSVGTSVASDPIEYLDREEFGIRRFFANRGSDGRAVSEPIDESCVGRSVGANRDAAGDAANVRMCSVNAAVDDRDANAAPREFFKEHTMRRARRRCRRQASAPDRPRRRRPPGA